MAWNIITKKTKTKQKYSTETEIENNVHNSAFMTHCLCFTLIENDRNLDRLLKNMMRIKLLIKLSKF